MGISRQPSNLLTVEAITAARTINASDSGKRFTVTSLVANYAITLPAPIAGLNFELLGAGASFYATLAYTGTLYVSNGGSITGGTWSNVNLAEVANSVRIWSDGSAWYLQTIAGRLLIDPGLTSDDYQAASIGQAVPKRTPNVTPVNITGAALISAANPLGYVPFFAEFEYVCLVAEQGFSVGEVENCSAQWNGTASSTMNVVKTASVVLVQLGAGFTPVLFNKTTGAAFTPTAANWANRFSVR